MKLPSDWPESSFAVEWNDLTNDREFPLPWWLGPRLTLESEIPGEHYLSVAHPRLHAVAESAVRRLLDIPSWGQFLSARGYGVVSIALCAESPHSVAGLHGGGSGLIFYGVPVPGDVAANPDAHAVVRWLVDKCVDACVQLSDQLRVPRPVIRIDSADSPAVEWLYGCAGEPTGQRVSELPPVGTDSGVGYLLGREFGDHVRAFPLAERLSHGPHVLGRPSATLPTGQLRGVAVAPTLPSHYDFSAVQYPAYLDDVMSRPGALLLAWKAIHSASGVDSALQVLRNEIRRTVAMGSLEAHTSGRDGDVLWILLAAADDDAPILERDRVDLGSRMHDSDDATTAPERIALDPDNHFANCIGRTADGRQYFVTAPFLADRSGARDFLALYLFDAAGSLLSDDVREVGRRGEYLESHERAIQQVLLGQLGERTVERVEVRPFSVRRFGMEFGLITTEQFGQWRVNAMPGDYMEFCPPWGSGIYDT